MAIVEILEKVAPTLFTGAGGFFGAFLQFKARLAKVEGLTETLKTTLDKEFPRLTQAVGALHSKVEELQTGWDRELSVLKEQIRREFQHAEALERAKEDARKSRPDPIEDLFHKIASLEKDVRELRTKNGRFVREDRFADFVAGQEESWRRVERALGEIQGMMNSLK